ncbi:MAG TPA: NUDIX hydrolase [Aeromicrobium sp.]|nr:NUDIX hydrolase [Aeromicrobium sp.]HKY56698.1 NUDIX hydrolase [Aeromicrobium sp.]
MNDHHPRLPGRIAPSDHGDSPASWPVASTTPRYDSAFLKVRTDAIVDPTGAVHDRVVVQPRGAVAVLALDEDARVLLVEQYRHPVGARLLELPAGTLDVEGESPLTAAQRELIEEGDVSAGAWEEMLELTSTPGYSTERWLLYRATDLSPVPHHERAVRHAEEADLEQWWMPLEDAVQAIFDGRISNALATAGIMSEVVRRSRDEH